MATIRRHPRMATLLLGMLIGVSLWALVPPAAEAAPKTPVTLRSLGGQIEDLQDSAVDLAQQLHQPPNWLGGVALSARFELVLPETVDGETVYKGVHDHRTGLIWKRIPARGTEIYSIARRNALISRDGDRYGWRLPYADEMLSILEPVGIFTQLDPDFPLPAGTGLVAGVFWTQTEANSEQMLTVKAFGPSEFIVGATGVELESRYWCVMGPGNQHR